MISPARYKETVSLIEDLGALLAPLNSPHIMSKPVPLLVLNMELIDCVQETVTLNRNYELSVMLGITPYAYLGPLRFTKLPRQVEDVITIHVAQLFETVCNKLYVDSSELIQQGDTALTQALIRTMRQCEQGVYMTPIRFLSYALMQKYWITYLTHLVMDYQAGWDPETFHSERNRLLFDELNDIVANNPPENKLAEMNRLQNAPTSNAKH